MIARSWSRQVSRLVVTAALACQTPSFAEVPNCRSLLRGLPLSEVAREVHGGDPLHPTPQSRLGQYLQQSGAQPFVFRFPADPANSAQGPEKLVVPVSPESFPQFAALFGSTLPNAFEHLHTPSQGTLVMRWMNQSVLYSVMRNDQWRFPQVGSIGPMILLSDSEAGRLNDYFEVMVANQNFRMPNTIPGYGYPADFYIGNCTAWVGHIPLGDRTVSSLTAPGNSDGPPASHTPPTTGTLADYNVDSVPGVPADKKALFRQVWSAPGHEPLFEMLGIPLDRANHTNPGWVALSLTGLVSNERVPFVVYYTQDHRAPVSNFNPQIRPVGP